MFLLKKFIFKLFKNNRLDFHLVGEKTMINKVHPFTKYLLSGIRRSFVLMDFQEFIFSFRVVLFFLLRLISLRGKILSADSREFLRSCLIYFMIKSKHFYQYHKWIGGTLSNFKFFRAFYIGIKNNFLPFKKYSSFLKYNRSLQSMKRLPNLIILTSSEEQTSILQEAFRVGIPICSTVTPFSFRPSVTFPIIYNSFNLRSLVLFYQILRNCLFTGLFKETFIFFKKFFTRLKNVRKHFFFLSKVLLKQPSNVLIFINKVFSFHASSFRNKRKQLRKKIDRLVLRMRKNYRKKRHKISINLTKNMYRYALNLNILFKFKLSYFAKKSKVYSNFLFFSRNYHCEKFVLNYENFNYSFFKPWTGYGFRLRAKSFYQFLKYRSFSNKFFKNSFVFWLYLLANKKFWYLKKKKFKFKEKAFKYFFNRERIRDVTFAFVHFKKVHSMKIGRHQRFFQRKNLHRRYTMKHLYLKFLPFTKFILHKKFFKPYRVFYTRNYIVKIFGYPKLRFFREHIKRLVYFDFMLKSKYVSIQMFSGKYLFKFQTNININNVFGVFNKKLLKTKLFKNLNFPSSRLHKKIYLKNIVKKKILDTIIDLNSIKIKKLKIIFKLWLCLSHFRKVNSCKKKVRFKNKKIYIQKFKKLFKFEIINSRLQNLKKLKLKLIKIRLLQKLQRIDFFKACKEGQQIFFKRLNQNESNKFIKLKKYKFCSFFFKHFNRKMFIFRIKKSKFIIKLLRKSFEFKIKRITFLKQTNAKLLQLVQSKFLLFSKNRLLKIFKNYISAKKNQDIILKKRKPLNLFKNSGEVSLLYFKLRTLDKSKSKILLLRLRNYMSNLSGKNEFMCNFITRNFLEKKINNVLIRFLKTYKL